MATTSVSAYLADPTHFTDPDPDYAAFQAAFGPGNAADRTVTASAVLGLAARSPVVIAFVLQGDEQCIHICHSLSKYPEDPLDGANPFNNLIVGLVGDDLASSVPIVFPVDAWARTNEIRCFNGDYMIGANGYGHVPVRDQFAVAGAAEAEAGGIRARTALVLPPAIASTYLTNADGRYTLVGFYNTCVG